MSGGRVLDSFELNKIFGGVLASVLLVLLVNTLGHSVFTDKPLEENAYIVEGVEEEGGEGAAAGGEKPQGPSLAVLLSQANPADGEKVFKKCATCHTINKGEAHKTGPSLYGTIGHKIASHDGYAYSKAFTSHGGTWDFETLSAYLENPKGYIPGNKMSFAGLKKPEERAAMLLYLNQHTDAPLPLPTPEAAPAPEAEADAPAETSAEAPAEAPAAQ